MEQTNITSDTNQSIATPTFNPITPKPNNIYKYLFFVTLFTLFILFGIVYYSYTTSKNKNPQLVSNNINNISKLTPTIPSVNESKSSSPTIVIEKSKSVLIYTEKISSVSNNGRLWPTLRIYRVINNSEPEVLVPSIGQVGEYPSDFLLSPDKKSILVNLETKLVAIDLVTKEVKDVLKFDQGGNYRGVNYSPDGKKLFVWDQQYASNVGNYSVYIYDITTKEKTILKNGTTNSVSMVVFKWRNDNKIILYKPQGESAEVWVFDLNNKTHVKREGGFNQLSENGMLMAQPYLTVNNPCSEMSEMGGGPEPGGYKLIDPATLALKDQIDGSGKVVSIIAMSPPGDQVIYSINDPIDPNKVKNISDCESLFLTRESSNQYFLKKLAEPQSPITDYKNILKKWGIQNGEAKNIGGFTIQNGTQMITGATEESELRIIAQFLQ